MGALVKYYSITLYRIATYFLYCSGEKFVIAKTLVTLNFKCALDLLEAACRASKSETKQGDHGAFYLHLPNLQFGPIISIKTVQERLEVFERYGSWLLILF